MVEALPNGMLVIEASREVESSQQTQTIILRGLMRSEDISQQNQILSTAISDLELQVKGKGIVTITRTGRTGWCGCCSRLWCFRSWRMFGERGMAVVMMIGFATKLQSAELQHQALLSVMTALDGTDLFSYMK